MIGTKLDDEFKKTASQINEKIVEAAKLIEEANRLGEEAGLKYIAYYPYDKPEIADKLEIIKFDKLFEALEGAGWHTSTMTEFC
jgi:hypothetical protein